MNIVWCDSYKIGNDEIDSQHRHLFELITHLTTAGDNAAIKLRIMQLYQHTRQHFQAEEAFMRKINFPDCKAHTQAHNNLLARLNTLSHNIAQGTATAQDIETLMHDWALRHVLHNDAEFVKYSLTHQATPTNNSKHQVPLNA